jgi:DNA-binding transcriptional LysR family regulator
MDIKELGRLDLNLLVALEALLEERNVSRAADRLFITQSAMSKTLGRLRDLFNDQLFTRSSSGMIPTPRALQLSEHLPQLLQAVQCMVQPQNFDPLTFSGDFNILIPDSIAIWSLPILINRLSKSAPKIRLKIDSQQEHQLESLASGKIDFIIQMAQNEYPAEFKVKTVGFAPTTLFARKGHPLADKPLTWDIIETYPHIHLNIPELADSKLATQLDSQFIQHERDVIPHIEMTNIFTALQIIKATDYLLPGPPIFVEEEDLSKDIVALELPENEGISIQYTMVYHERIESSAPHQYLFSEMIDTIQTYRVMRGLPTLEDMRKLRNLAY